MRKYIDKTPRKGDLVIVKSVPDVYSEYSKSFVGELCLVTDLYWGSFSLKRLRDNKPTRQDFEQRWLQSVEEVVDGMMIKLKDGRLCSVEEGSIIDWDTKEEVCKSDIYNGYYSNIKRYSISAVCTNSDLPRYKRNNVKNPNPMMSVVVNNR